MFDATAPTTDKRLEYFDQQLIQKRQVKLKTCADVYNYWRNFKRLYKKAPKDGVEFQVEYIDTGLALNEELRSKAPIALALHGAPGSYHDFALLIRHLSKQNVRVIAPNFPEYTATVKTKVLFRHSADEKAAYLRDFLKAINVNKIDLLVSHSSAIFPTLLILLNANNQAIAKQNREPSKQQSNQQQIENNQEQDDTRVISSMIKDMALAEAGAENTDSGIVDTSNKDVDCTGSQQCADEMGDAATQDGEAIENDEDYEEDEEDEDDEEEEEDFVDAKDEVISNNNNDNNNNSVNKKLDQDCERLAISEKQLPQQQQIANVGCKKRQKVRANKKRRSEDVIVKFDQPIEIKAVALLNPAGHRLPKSMKPTWFKCGSVRIYQHKLGRSLFRKLGPAFLTVVGVPVRVDNMDNVMLSATVMRNSKCQRVVKQLQQLSEMKLPTLLVFSENDKLIEKEIFYEMTQFMRLDPKNFDIFNNEGDIEVSQSLKKDWIRVMVFKAGGHYAYSNYANTVNKAVGELLKKVAKDPSLMETPVESC